MSSQLPPDLPPGVGYAGAAPVANGHGPPGHHGHYAVLTQVTLPISGLEVTVRPVDGLDMYRLGLPPTFFASEVAERVGAAPTAGRSPDPEAATGPAAAQRTIEIMIQAADRFPYYAVLHPRPVRDPSQVTGPGEFCPDLLPTADRVWLLNQFVTPAAVGAAGAAFRDAGVASPSLEPARHGADVRPAPQRLPRAARGQRRGA